MKSNLNHLQVNIDPKNLSFYKDLMKFLGWKVLVDMEEMVGFGSDSNGSLWFLKKKSKAKNNYDGAGVNHIGIWVDSIAAVDKAAKYLKQEGIKLLFETPRHRPEFSGPNDTYYQVMFESPDKILLEIVYTGSKK